jgi:hypothetical protein
MEFLVEFEVIVPDATPESEVEARERAEASAAAELEPHPNDPDGRATGVQP